MGREDVSNLQKHHWAQGTSKSIGSGRDPGVLGSSPVSGSLLLGESAALCLSLYPPPRPVSLSQTNFKNLKKKKSQSTLFPCSFLLL